jgi:hypothetical protein
MAWTAPRTWVTGEVVTAAQLNEQVRDNTRYLKGLDGAVTIGDALAITGALTGVTSLTMAGALAGATTGSFSGLLTTAAITASGLITANGGITLGGTLDANQQNITSVKELMGHTAHELKIRGKRQVAAGDLLLSTTGVTPGFADTTRVQITGGAVTAVAAWSNITHTGIVLSGALDANSQNFTSVGTIGCGGITTTAQLYMTEQAASGGSVATRGEFWVRNDAPCVPMFTDDAGADWNLVSSTRRFFSVPTYTSGAIVPLSPGAVAQLTVAAQKADGAFVMPWDYNTLVSAELVVMTGVTGTFDWTLNTQFATNGEAYNTHTDSATEDTRVATDTQMDYIDVSAAFTGVAALDWVGWSFVLDALDTTTSVNVVGLKFRYT